MRYTVLTHGEVHAVEHRPDDRRLTGAFSVVRQELQIEYPETKKTKQFQLILLKHKTDNSHCFIPRILPPNCMFLP